MELDTIFNDYLKKSEQLLLNKRLINKITEDEIQRLVKMNDEETVCSMDFFYIQDAESGQPQRYKYTQSTIAEKTKIIKTQKNKQYQWVLAESYEIFKDYLTNIYAYLGYLNNDYWVLKDYENITLSDLGKKDFSFFLNLAKAKRKTPKSILNRIRIILPKYKRVESDNKLNKQLNFHIVLIEHFRHIIVHCGGKTSDVKNFCHTVLKVAGLLNNSKYNQDKYDYISSFFKCDEFINTICLLEYYDQESVTDQYYDILGDLINSLTSIAYLIHQEINKLNK